MPHLLYRREAVLYSSSSLQFDDVFAAVCGITDKTLADGIDHEIEQFQRYLTDQYGAIVRQFGDVAWAVPSLNRQANGAVNLNRCRACTGPRLSCA
jgi:hypothetical protein